MMTPETYLVEMAQSQAAIPGSNISFERTGGRFVSYKTAAILAVLFLAILFLVFFLGRFSTIGENKVADDAPVLLQSIDPLHYTLVLKTVLNRSTTEAEQFAFSGQVDIVLRVKESTNHIQLHSRNLKIKTNHTVLRRLTEPDDRPHFEHMMEADLLHNVGIWKNLTGINIEIDEQELNIASEKFDIQTAEDLQAEVVYLLSIQFKGQIKEEAAGLYRTKYMGQDNQLRWIVATKLEPDYARQVFPCFDEPYRKALFSITLYHPQEYKAFSNMAVKSSHKDHNTGSEVTEFNTSPRLPPYLVSIVLTNGYVSRSPEDKENVWTQPQLLAEADHARGVTLRLIKYFQGLLNNDLPLDKIDFVGIPDYSTRGSESFGLVALEENTLLYNSENSSLEDFESVTLHIGFHMAQQWFSNMITPRSWDVLWLREAFAKYLSYNAFAEVVEGDQLSLRFLVNEMYKSMHADSLRDAHPLLQMSLKNPKDIRSLNQELVYRKGGCLIRMLKHFIGDLNFKHGLQQYKKDWYLKSTSSSDVWESFDKSINNLKMYDFNVSVRQAMQSWTGNKGYPLVTVQIDRKTKVATFTQEPFSMFSDSGPEEWYIPISYTTREEKVFNSTKVRLWLTSRETVTKSLNMSNPIDTWIIANINQTGYFRVNYDTVSWDILLKHLNEDYFSIPTLSRYQLLDDAFALAHGGYIRYSIPLDLSSIIGKHEKYLIPCQGLLKHISFMDNIFAGTEYILIYKQYATRVLTRIYEDLIKIREPNVLTQENVHLLYLLSSEMCRLNYENCKTWANKQFRETSSNGETTQKITHGSLRGTVYSVIARHGSNEDWSYFWNKINDTNVDPTEKFYLAEGLASTPNLTTVHELLTRISSEDDSVIHKSIKVEIWTQLGKHMQNIYAYLSFLRKFWGPLYLKLQNHGDLLQKLVTGVAYQLGTEEHLKSVRELKNYHLSICAPEDKLLFDHIMEEISFKIHLRDSHLQEILAWMNNYTASV